MSESSTMDKTFHIIMKWLVDTGQAPHYTEIAAGRARGRADRHRERRRGDLRTRSQTPYLNLINLIIA